MGLCNRYEREICAEKEEVVSVVKGREGRSTKFHTRITEERIYLTLKVTSNSTSVLCRKEEW